jgi:hypothetical protein
MSEQELNIVVEHYENDELAAANEALADAYFSIRGENERVVAENAKLHDLIEAVLQCAGEIKRDKGCDACPMWNGDDTGAFHERRWCLLRPTLREVGFEVGDA